MDNLPAPTAFSVPDRDGSSNNGSVTLKGTLAFFRAAASSAAFWAVALTSLAIVYILMTPPSFVASAKLAIDPGRPQVLPEAAARSEMDFIEHHVESAVEVIKSEQILTRAIHDLDLLNDPEFASPSPSIVDRFGSLIGQNSTREMVGSSEGDELRLRFVVASLASRLSVRRIGRSFVLEVSFSSSWPDKAAKIANAIASAYITEDLQARSNAAMRGSQWLQERLELLREQAYDAARAVERFKSVGGSTSPADAAVELAELESVSETYRRTYEVYLQKYTETVQAASYPDSDARIVDQAAPPLGQSHPKSVPILAFAFVVGCALGLLLYLFRRALDNRIRTSEQIEREISVACLGVVRKTHRDKRRILRADRPNNLLEKSLQATLRFVPATLDDLRSVKAALNGVTLGRSPRCYGVMPVASATGSTTVTNGLATLFALSGERVLLIDANFECPTISEDVGALGNPGLLQIIDDPDITERVIVEWSVSGLHVLPCGYMSGQTAPGDKLSSMQMAQKIGELRQSFGTIFFDLPSLTRTIDAEAIAHLLDGIILVASYDSSTRDALQKACTAITRSRGYVAGVVINNAPPGRRK